MTSTAEHEGISRAVLGLLGIARGILSDLDLDVVLDRVLEFAREVSGARYGALGVLDPTGLKLERFLTAGLDEPTRRGIGEPPKGRGVLGELITNPVTLRLEDVGAHPHSYGFPQSHPPMKTFLGVPVVVRGRPFGNLYLTEKSGGEPFDEQDEQIVELVAELAGVAIDHARRPTGPDARQTELRRTLDALDATLQIARALGGETDLDRIHEVVAKRARALVSARLLVIEQEQAGEMLIVAGAGELPAGLIGQRVELADGVARAALGTSRTVRVEDELEWAPGDRHGLGQLGVQADAELVVPLLFRRRARGVLIALDRLRDGPAFTADDQRVLEAFAASAATAIAAAETVRADRDGQPLAAAEVARALGEQSRDLVND